LRSRGTIWRRRRSKRLVVSYAGLIELKLQGAAGDDVNARLLHVSADTLLDIVGSGGEIEALEVMRLSGERAVYIDLRVRVGALDANFSQGSATVAVWSVSVAGIVSHAPRAPVWTWSPTATVKADTEALGRSRSRNDQQQRRDERGEDNGSRNPCVRHRAYSSGIL